MQTERRVAANPQTKPEDVKVDWGGKSKPHLSLLTPRIHY